MTAGPNWSLGLAKEFDIPALEALIPVSVRGLQAAHYSPAQMEAALGPVFGVDRQLIRDGTYFVVEHEGTIVGCGGWSRRKSLYGGDAGRAAEDPLLDPHTDAARVRAFFVHPSWARRGIGRGILAACENAIAQAGFRRIEIVATLAGEPLYASFGYTVERRSDIPLPGGLSLAAVHMQKRWGFRPERRDHIESARQQLVPFQPEHADKVLSWAATQPDLRHWASLDAAPTSRPFAAWHSDPDSVAFVLIEDREAAAYGEVWFERAEAAVELGRILVDPRRRRRGTGKRLVQALVQEASQEWVKTFWVRVYPGNEAALALYAACGFQGAAAEQEDHFNAEQSIAYRWLFRPRD